MADSVVIRLEVYFYQLAESEFHIKWASFTDLVIVLAGDQEGSD